MTKVTILGGGIGGVEAAIALRTEKLDVELISDRDYLFVYPLAIWIPTGEKSFEQVQISLAEIAKAHGFKLTIDEVQSLSAAGKSFCLEMGGRRTDFDYLIVALGAGKMSHKGKEHVLSICGPPLENVELRKRLDDLIARGQGDIAVGFGGNPKDGSAVRGGPGFEFLLNLDHRLRRLGLRDRFTLTFFAPMPQPGIRMGEKAVAAMESMFRKLGIRSYTGKKITEFDEHAVVLEDGTRLEADLVMFIAAGDGHPLIKVSDLPQNEAGFVLTEPSCQVQDLAWLYAIGDTAALQGPDWKAKQGHMAEIMAHAAAKDINRKIEGGTSPASYVDDVCILCVMDMGNGAGFVYRDEKHSVFLPMPVVGHWLKKSWGKYYRLRKLGKVPRIPGL